MPKGIYQHKSLSEEHKKNIWKALSGRLVIPREIRYCNCGCGGSFKCKINSKKRFLYGHNRRGMKRQFTKEHISKLTEIRRSRNPDVGFRQGISLSNNAKINPNYGMKGKHHTRETIDKILNNEGYINKKSNSKILHERYSNGEIAIWNKGLTKETDERVFKNTLGFMRISKENKGRTYSEIYGEERACNVRNKQSYTHANNIVSGKVNPTASRKKFKQGHFFSKKNNKLLFHRSSLELLAYQLLEGMSKVVMYEVEPFSIKYYYNGAIKRYIVDLLVYYNDGSKDLIEVKGSWDLVNDQVKAKLNAGRNYAYKNNSNFLILTEKDLLNKEV